MSLRPLFLATLAAFAAGSAVADDASIGKQLTYTCTGCHGITGYKNVYPHYHVPKITGQSREYLVIALKAYQSGERSHPTMRAQGEGLTDEEINQIAAYLAAPHGENR